MIPDISAENDGDGCQSQLTGNLQRSFVTSSGFARLSPRILKSSWVVTTSLSSETRLSMPGTMDLSTIELPLRGDLFSDRSSCQFTADCMITLYL